MENKKTSTNRKSKPTFVVKESKFSSRVKSRWRFPRGKHSKVRQMHRGRPAMPNPGFGSPVKSRGLLNGLTPVIVNNVKQLEKIDVKTEGVIISGKVGSKKRLELVSLADEKRITLLNVKNSAELIKKIKGIIEARKNTKKDKLKKKNEKEAEKKKKAEKKKDKDKEKSAESVEDKIQKSEEEKKEQQKIAEKTITKKQ